MKRILLPLIVFFACILISAVVGAKNPSPDPLQHTPSSREVDFQKEQIEITIGDNQVMPPFRMPLDFFHRNQINQTIYFDWEMDSISGLLTGLTYYSNFVSNIPQREVRFYAASTTATSIPSGYLPGNIFTPVFDGKIDFHAGPQAVYIPFEQPFYHQGGNLVIMSNRVYNNIVHTADDKFYATTNLANWDRSRQSVSSTVIFDPMNLPTGGTGRAAAPNTTLHFDTSPLGGLQGIVADASAAPLANALITIDNTTFRKKTDHQGEFSFSHLPAGMHNLGVNLQGYFPVVVPFEIAEGETTALEISLTEITLLQLSGMIAGTQMPESGLEGALIELSGYDYFHTTTTADGTFEIENVFGHNTYILSISHPEHFTYYSTLELSDSNYNTGTIVINERAYHVWNVEAEETEQGAMIAWHDPYPGDDFRYDDGSNKAHLGFNFGTFNSILGAVHQRHAELHNISWYLTSNNAHPLVNLWILGLDENGMPDRNNVLHHYTEVPNSHNQWNTWNLPEPVLIPGGFYLGVSTAGFLGLATDDGAGEPWEFMPGTHFGIFNINDPLYVFTDVAEWGHTGSFLLRAGGFDFGPAEPWPAHKDNKVLETYRVFRLQDQQIEDPGSWTLISDNLAQQQFLDSQWHELDHGVYHYAVTAQYTNGVLSRPVFSNALPNNMMVPYTVVVTTNSGDSPQGAMIELAGKGEFDYHNYQMPVSGNEAVFSGVWRTIYDVTVSLDGFITWTQYDVEILEEGLTLEVELTEDIASPYGLMVETEELQAGQALFSWNNFFGYPEFFDGFESGDFQAWGQFIQGPGTPGNQGNAYWYATDIVDGNNPPQGQFVAKANWGYDIDTWLISPMLYFDEGTAISFNWFSSYHWSVYPNPHAQLMVKISQDEGETWTQLWNWQQIGEWETFTWQQSVLDLSEYAHQSVLLAFHLLANNNAVTQIDNIIIDQGMEPGNRSLGQPLKAFSPDARTLGSFGEKALLGYNIFLNDMEIPVIQIPSGNQYLFEQLPEGDHIAGVQAVYTTGESIIVTIPFSIQEGYQPELFEVIFNVDMQSADFGPDNDVVFIAGDFNEWAVPGSMPSVQEMVYTGDALVYSITLNLQAGIYEYKYFMNAGWDGAEWEGDPLRVAEINQDTLITNVFGNQWDEVVNVTTINPGAGLSIFPNPASRMLNIVSPEAFHRVQIVGIDGRVVARVDQVSNSMYISVDHLLAGIYIVQIYTLSGIIHEKLHISK